MNIAGKMKSTVGKSIFTGAFIAFVILLAIAEKMGLPPQIIGYIFMGVTIGVYTLIGVVSRTRKISEYYVAGRSVPPIFNGMATGSDWMSAARTPTSCFWGIRAW